MTDVNIKRGAVRYTIKGATPILVTKGNALMVTSKVTPIVKASERPVLRLVQKAS